MDPLTHTLVGASLAQSGLRTQSRFAAAALIVGANVPDVDALAYFLTDSDTSLWIRRGWTHGIPALFVWPFVLVGAFVLLERLFQEDGAAPVRPIRLWAVGAVGVWSHPALDWLNNYGMRWWMPFDGTWYYGDAVFILDPWMWLLLGGAVGLSQKRDPTRRAAFGVMAIIASALVLFAVPGLLISKALWFAGLGVISVNIFGNNRRTPMQGHPGRRSAQLAVAAFILYVGAMLWIARSAVQSTHRLAQAQGLTLERVMVGPTPLTPFVKDVVIETQTGYRFGNWRIGFPFTQARLELSTQSIPKLEGELTEQIETAWHSNPIRGFRNWARFPSVQVDATAPARRFHFFDVRYVRDPETDAGARFGIAVVQADP